MQPLHLPASGHRQDGDLRGRQRQHPAAAELVLGGEGSGDDGGASPTRDENADQRQLQRDTKLLLQRLYQQHGTGLAAVEGISNQRLPASQRFPPFTPGSERDDDAVPRPGVQRVQTHGGDVQAVLARPEDSGFRGRLQRSARQGAGKSEESVRRGLQAF